LARLQLIFKIRYFAITFKTKTVNVEMANLFQKHSKSLKCYKYHEEDILHSTADFASDTLYLNCYKPTYVIMILNLKHA